MPEGDTIYNAAATLRKVLLGRTITRFETSLAAVAAVDVRTPVAGRVVSAVEPRGKHLLITFAPRSEDAPEDAASGKRETGESGGTAAGPELPAPGPADLLLHTHMRMTGSWHLYRPGEAWRKPAAYAKVVLHTADFVVPCFNAPVVELLTRRQAERHPDLLTLGPDAITPEFDPAEARRRMLLQPETEIAVALLDQRVLAGVGNIYKSEVLFAQRISPFRRVGELDPGALDGLIAEAHRLLSLNRERGLRRTVFGLREDVRLWVYGRSGEPCRVCGTPIRMRRQGAGARSTYYCPRCQETGE